MTTLPSHRAPSAAMPGDAPAAPIGLTLRQRAMLWAPWMLVLMITGLAILTAAWAAVGLFAARQLLAERESALAIAESSLPVGATGRVGPQADVIALEDAAAQLITEPSRLLEAVEGLAADAGVVLLQFLPDPSPPGAGTAAVRLQSRGAEEAVWRFLAGLGERAPAVEVATLRLAAAEPGSVLVELGLRLHDEPSLMRVGQSPPAVLPAGGAGIDNDLVQVPAALFGTASAVADSTEPFGRAGVESRVAVRAPVPDPLAGVRLAGVLGAPGRLAALLEVPGIGAVLLRPNDRLGDTHFRIERVAPGHVVLTGVAGERRVFELSAPEGGAP
jgi:hypothetical protein